MLSEMTKCSAKLSEKKAHPLPMSNGPTHSCSFPCSWVLFGPLLNTHGREISIS